MGRRGRREQDLGGGKSEGNTAGLHEAVRDSRGAGGKLG